MALKSQRSATEKIEAVAQAVHDAAVVAAYGKKSLKNDAERVAFLFELYQKYTSRLPGVTKLKLGAV